MKPSTNQPSVNRIGPATAPSASRLPSLRSGQLARPAAGCLLIVAIGGASLLRQADFQADPLRGDGTGPERALGGELSELRGRVGAALEHLERRHRRE